ncbi:MAG: cysteine hydrolase, partial [Pseudomonas sagittaria]|nr:cysteine hydrolase [Pseudomonas sagittaria]
MSDAKTLFELTGSGYPAADLKQATLLIIDAQNEYRNGDL